MASGVTDTRTFPVGDRMEALRTALGNRGNPVLIIPETRHGIRVKVGSYRLTSSLLASFSRGTTGVEITQPPRMARRAGVERLVFAIAHDASYFLETEDRQCALAPGELFAVDLSKPYRSGWTGSGGANSIYIDWAQLGLPADRLRAAVPRLSSSPLYGLARDHLTQLLALSEDTLTGVTRGRLGSATTDVLRALVSSASPATGRNAFDDSLRSRVVAYLNVHYREAGLTPGSVAAALHMSLRQLYVLWSLECDVTLMQWIVSRRLARARELLAQPGSAAWTVEKASEYVGFVNSAHFSRRFRQAYGMSPTEWRRATNA